MATGDNHGYIKASRKQFRPCEEGGCPWWNTSREFSKWEAWVDVIQMAAYREICVPVAGSVVQLNPGETPPLSLRRMALRWGWSVKRSRRFITQGQRLELFRRGREFTSGTTLVIRNFDQYSADEDGFLLPRMRFEGYGSGARVVEPPSYVYLMLGPETGSARAAKIGISNAPSRRVDEVQCPLTGEAPELHATIYIGPGARSVEAALHKKLTEHKIQGEWFEAEPATKEFMGMVDRGVGSDA